MHKVLRVNVPAAHVERSSSDRLAVGVVVALVEPGQGPTARGRAHSGVTGQAAAVLQVAPTREVRARAPSTSPQVPLVVDDFGAVHRNGAEQLVEPILEV